MQADLAQREGTNTEDLKRSLRRSAAPACAPPTPSTSCWRWHGPSAVPAMPGCNLVRIVTDVVQDCLPRAMDKHIDLGYEGASASTPGVWLNGNATLLAELVRNLVDNAINYTPSTSEQPGVVTVRVQADHFGRFCCCRSRTQAPACRWPSAN
jgi:two-component system sensor histidine kinase TctE